MSDCRSECAIVSVSTAFFCLLSKTLHWSGCFPLPFSGSSKLGLGARFPGISAANEKSPTQNPTDAITIVPTARVAFMPHVPLVIVGAQSLRSQRAVIYITCAEACCLLTEKSDDRNTVGGAFRSCTRHRKLRPAIRAQIIGPNGTMDAGDLHTVRVLPLQTHLSIGAADQRGACASARITVDT